MRTITVTYAQLKAIMDPNSVGRVLYTTSLGTVTHATMFGTSSALDGCLWVISNPPSSTTFTGDYASATEVAAIA
jgi:hypothetical protein